MNAPRCPHHSYHRDGTMRVDGNFGSTIGYEPNSTKEWQEQPDFRQPPLSLEGAADHWNHREDDDYFSQPGNLFRLMTPHQQQALFENTARAMSSVSRDIQLRHIGQKQIRLMATVWLKPLALPNQNFLTNRGLH